MPSPSIPVSHHRTQGPDLIHRRRLDAAALLILAPALAGVCLVLVATRPGAGISVDSVVYLGVAREFAAGRGLVIPWGADPPSAMGTVWAPLLSILLGAISWLGPDPVDAVRWLNAACFGGTIALTGLMLRRATGSTGLGLCGAALIATSRLMLAVHAMAWSEPLFLLLSLSALWLLAAYQANRRLRLLAGFCIAAAAAFLTRYAGGALLVTAFACLVMGAARRKGRALAAMCVAALAFLPMTPGGPSWARFLWDHFTGVGGFLQPDSPALLRLSGISSAATVLSDWVWPWALSTIRLTGPAQGMLAILFALLVCLVTLQARRSPAFRNAVSPQRGKLLLCWTCGLFLLAYPCFLVVAILFFDRTFAFDQRILLPLMVPSLLLLLTAGHLAWERSAGRRFIGGLAVAACVVALTVRIPRAVDRSIEIAATSGAGAEGFHDARWRSSPAIAAVRALPASTRIYSNAPDAIYILTGRPALWLPNRVNGHYQRPPAGENPSPDLQRLGADLRNGARIVLFDRLSWRRYSPSRRDLQQSLALRTVTRTGDGEVLCAAPPPGEALAGQPADEPPPP